MASKQTPIATWLATKGLTVAAACDLTKIPVPTFYRLLAEEEKYGRLRRVRGSTLDRLIAGSGGFLRADELLGVGAPSPARAR